MWKTVLSVASFGFSIVAFSWLLSIMGVTGSLDNDTIAVIIMVSVAIHEFGHMFTMQRCGFSCSMVFIPLLGAAVKPDDTARFNKLHWYKDAWISLAGPLMNIVLLLVGLIMLCIDGLRNYGYTIASVNASLAVFNLIPVGILDGGRFVKALFNSMDERTDHLIVEYVTTAIVVVGLILAFWGKLPVYAILVTFLIRWESGKDNPDDYKLPRAMTKKQGMQLTAIYIAIVISSLIANAFLPGLTLKS